MPQVHGFPKSPGSSLAWATYRVPLCSSMLSETPGTRFRCSSVSHRTAWPAHTIGERSACSQHLEYSRGYGGGFRAYTLHLAALVVLLSDLHLSVSTTERLTRPYSGGLTLSRVPSQQVTIARLPRWPLDRHMTYYNAPNESQLREHYENLPHKLREEDIDPHVPWLYGFKLDFRFR